MSSFDDAAREIGTYIKQNGGTGIHVGDTAYREMASIIARHCQTPAPDKPAETVPQWVKDVIIEYDKEWAPSVDALTSLRISIMRHAPAAAPCQECERLRHQNKVLGSLARMLSRSWIELCDHYDPPGKGVQP